eukprot:TRINITY_DN13631_c0_g1_i1.p1 TRINITY_DN13631_c0_g1~~TRINITY_DN13631_c0_g1_i1.p1  ORF type:complete len:775 (+),score=339.75 TRINITY_DN13631_c0_g1_i1:22-2346(+)
MRALRRGASKPWSLLQPQIRRATMASMADVCARTGVPVQWVGDLPHPAEEAGKEAVDMSIYTIPMDTPVVGLKATDAFNMLTEDEKAYAYYIGRASWDGAKICLLQTSPESVPIFSLFQLCFGSRPAAEMAAAATAAGGCTEAEAKQALMFAAAFYGNMGNYKSFGDTKFIPLNSPRSMKAFLLDGSGVGGDAEKKGLFEKYWEAACPRMYGLTPRQRQLGLGEKSGLTTYFTANCEEVDADLATKFLESKGVSAYNTRLFKSADGKQYTVKVASSEKRTVPPAAFGGKEFSFEYGDHAPLMARIAENLAKAIPHAANEHQRSMLKEYVTSFTEGCIDAHKEGSRHWIKDAGPAVESYIGFIESYRDPSGLRGEWEGFAACVNKEVSKKFQLLVDKAEELLKLMPWAEVFEKKEFQKPDFTSLEVLAFGSSGVPAGINIPNYDDIRQNEGFKNVSLGNVLQASYGAGDKPVTFVAENDQALFKKLKGEAFELQVGVHELLGHGSGRLYHRNTADTAAYVAKGFKDEVEGDRPLDGPFYADGATWDSTFGKAASPYEECRAECSGIYLSLEKAVLDVFGHTDAVAGEMHDITYINWLLMVRAGLVGLEFYTPETQAWRQAHMNARYVILRVLLEAGEGLVRIESKTHEDGEATVEVHLARDKIATVGKAAIGKFLNKLQIYKSLGDVERGNAMFGGYSQVPEDMLALRKVVMARKEPRKLLIQPHMSRDDAAGTCAIQEFPEAPEGMVASFAARYPAVDAALWDLYTQEAAAMDA